MKDREPVLRGINMKTCTGCRQELPVSEFYRGNDQRDGRTFRCKTCINRYHAQRREQYPDQVREQQKRGRRKYELKQYGLTEEAFEAILEAAQGACEICGGRERLCIDHDHETLIVRGILCDDCNVALGRFRDDVARIQAAAKYLEERSRGVAKCA